MTFPIIDCHQHLIYPDKFPYSWTNGIPQLAGKAFTYEDYLLLIKGNGEVRAIFMESAPDDPHWRAESEFAMSLADRKDSIIDGLILNCRPESAEGFEEYIESIAHPKLVGLRRILHVMPDEISQSPRFAENIRLLEYYELTFDLCFLQRQLPLAAQLAAKCSNVQMVLDHCGVPDIAGGDFAGWKQQIDIIAGLPNVACKISGLLTYCPPDKANIDTIRPYVEHSIAAFGWDRVVWGGDWPVVCINSSLPDWIDISRELLQGEDEANQRKFFQQNARQIYGLY